MQTDTRTGLFGKSYEGFPVKSMTPLALSAAPTSGARLSQQENFKTAPLLFTTVELVKRKWLYVAYVNKTLYGEITTW